MTFAAIWRFVNYPSSNTLPFGVAGRPAQQERRGGGQVSLEVDIKEAVKGLVVAAGMAASVAQADIAKAAEPIVRNHPRASLQEVEAEIARHLRNQG